MSNLIAIVFNKHEEAEEARKVFSAMDEKDRLNLEDAVIAFKTEENEIQIEQQHEFVSVGAKQGGIVGLIIGTVWTANPAGGAIGAVAGAIVGSGIGAALEEAIDPGIDSDFVETVTEKLSDGKVVIFVLFSQVVWPDKFLKQLEKIGGTVIYTSLSEYSKQLFKKRLVESTSQL